MPRRQQQFGVADVTLSALAEGEYVLELSLTKNGDNEVVSYGFQDCSVTTKITKG